MTDKRIQELQKALGEALYPLGITVHRGALTHAAGESYYLIYDVDVTDIAWANNRAIIQRVDVETRYFARHPPIPDEHMTKIAKIMGTMGYRQDGLPTDAPTLATTDYVGEITSWTRTDVI